MIFFADGTTLITASVFPSRIMKTKLRKINFYEKIFKKKYFLCAGGCAELHMCGGILNTI